MHRSRAWWSYTRSATASHWTGYNCLHSARYHGSLISASTLQDFVDVVASQGTHLHTRPNTPIHALKYLDAEIENFGAALTHKLSMLLSRQESRRARYYNAVDEWPTGHTPPEVIERHGAEIERLYDLLDAPSPPSDSIDDESPETKAALERWREIERIWYKPKSDHRLEQQPVDRPSASLTHNLETSCSNSGPVSAPSYRQFPLSSRATSVPEATAIQGKKRRRSDKTEEREEAEKSQTMTKKARFIVTAAPAHLRRSVRLYNARLRRGAEWVIICILLD